MSAVFRRWDVPSFDPPKPKRAIEKVPPPTIQLPTVEEVEGIRVTASEEGFVLGREEGFKRGLSEGYQQGFDDGSAKGYAAAYAEGVEQIQHLSATLVALVEGQRSLVDEIGGSLVELAYQVGERMAGGQPMAREFFTNAVMEALGRIPRPGEHLFLRVHPAESALWAQLAEGEQQVCKVVLVEDEDIARGSCFVEVEGLRLDLGTNSRRALVRQALGLPLDGDD